MVAVMATAPPGQASESWFDAVKAGDLHSVRHLLAEAAHRDTNGEEARCEQGGTGLMWAAAEGRLEVLCELLSHSSLDLEARDRRAGGTALIWAASRNQVEALEVLLAHGACAGRPATLQNGGDSSKQVRRPRPDASRPALRLVRSLCARNRLSRATAPQRAAGTISHSNSL